MQRSNAAKYARKTQVKEESVPQLIYYVHSQRRVLRVVTLSVYSKASFKMSFSLICRGNHHIPVLH